MKINILLFENFTALDAFGPAEVLNRVKEWQTRLAAKGMPRCNSLSWCSPSWI